MTKQNTTSPAADILVAELLSPHGLRGAMHAEAYSDQAERFSPGQTFFTEQGQQLLLQSAALHKGKMLLSFEGIESREQAEQLRKTKLFVNSVLPLPAGSFYHFQLIGLEVRENGLRLGEISDVLSGLANDVYVVKLDSGGELLLPALKSVVQQVDLAQGLMLVDVPDGLRD